MSSVPPHRIDPPDPTVPRIAGRGPASTPRKLAATGPVSDLPRNSNAGQIPDRLDGPHPSVGPDPSEATGSVSAEACSRDHWLRFQAADLIDWLQSWASELDAREAQLNARASLQDHRERRFRLQQQDAETELAEQQRSIGRLRHEIEAQARRLAFLDDSAP